MDYSIPHYEFNKDCHCGKCNSRSKYDRGLSNHLTVTTDKMELFPEIEKIINDYTCGENHYIGRKYISFIYGETKENII